jgi:hypothetical protein
MNCGQRRAFIWILVALSLSACANPQKQAADRAAALRAQVEGYCRQLYSDPRIDPIRSKVPVGIGLSEQIPIQMMSNNEFPSKEEAPAILVWAEQRQRCHEYQTSLFGPPPAHLEALRRANSQLMADLYGGAITYGEYAKQLNQNTSLFLQQDASIRAQAARDRLQAIQAFQQNLYQRQQLNLERQRLQNEQLRAMQPQQNPAIHCTTQYIGNQAYTNCQ